MRLECIQNNVCHFCKRMFFRKDMTPRTYEAKPKKSSKPPKDEPQVGLRVPVFLLNGFWLLANRRNHCYANSVLQILHWAIPSDELSLWQEPRRVSQLARLTPEHPSLEPATRGWTFDGRQQDAAEFLTAILPNFSSLVLGGLGDSLSNGSWIHRR